MDWHALFQALALVLVIEGLMPFLAPAKWRQALLSIAGLADQALRIVGLMLIVVGVVLLNFS